MLSFRESSLPHRAQVVGQGKKESEEKPLRTIERRLHAAALIEGNNEAGEKPLRERPSIYWSGSTRKMFFCGISRKCMEKLEPE